MVKPNVGLLSHIAFFENKLLHSSRVVLGGLGGGVQDGQRCSVMWFSKPLRSVNIQRGVRESCCLRSGQLEHLSKINYPTQAIVQTKSPRIFELILCQIFSTTTGWSYPSGSRATRAQQSGLLHKTGSSWVFLGGSQTMHPTQTSPFLRRLC
jgi:hypothetical protein